jgi:hypothetical protein
MVLITVGAAVGFLAWFGVSATNDFRLSHHGAVVKATVEDTAASGNDTEYLLSFVVDGQSEAQWSSDVRGLKVGLPRRHLYPDGRGRLPRVFESPLRACLQLLRAVSAQRQARWPPQGPNRPHTEVESTEQLTETTTAWGSPSTRLR